MGALDASETAVRTADDPERAEAWALVLASAGIAHAVARSAGGWAVVVAPSDAAAAAAALDAYDREALAPAEQERPAPDLGSSYAGAAIATALVCFFLGTGGRESGGDGAWFRAGAASADLILRGQIWRAVTALTLHADLVHVIGNAIAALIFVAALGRWLGGGLATTLTLLAGAAGNLLTAAWHGHAHRSVGASTATFGALGILAGLQFVRRRRTFRWRRRAWVSIGAGLGLFAMIGVGEHVDVAAHLFGLLAGVLIGVAAGRAAPHRFAWPLQATLAAASAAAVVGCWVLALRAWI